VEADDEAALIEDFGKLSRDPYRFVLYAFPWGEPGELAEHDGPDEWQRDVLIQIRDGLNPAAALQIAVASGHGPGKSGLVAWLILWSLATFEDAKGICTANTEVQLRTKTWAEVSKWYRLFIGKHLFHLTATAIYAANPEHEKTWRIDAIAWSERNTEAFAGLHNQSRRVCVFFDEASAIPDVIWETTEGALTDADTEIIWCAFGNPTRNTGRFRECWGKFRERWLTYQVDSRTAKLTNKEQIAIWLKDYGEDSDFFRVRVRGVFPRAGSMQFIASDVAEAAMSPERQVDATVFDPLVMGVDVARFGDDASVIRLRRGRDARTIPAIKLRGVDTMTLAAKIMEVFQAHHPDAIFIDEGGVGGGVVDRCRFLRLPVVGVQFGAKADQSYATQDGLIAYANKRAEMWGTMRQWLIGGMLEKDPDMLSDLTGVEYGYRMVDGRDAIQLESKADMKRRGLASCDNADALCLVGGTMVETPAGPRAIEEIQPGDPVVTPFGVARVAVAWRSDTDRLTTVRFSNGAVLAGKGEHKVFAWGIGALRLDALPLTVEVETHTRLRLAAWRAASSLCFEARNIGFKRVVDIFSRGKRLTGSAFFIAASGLTITVQFRRAWTCITSTMIGATRCLGIWSYARRPLTAGITSQSGWRKTRFTLPNSGNMRVGREFLRLRGIEAKPAWSGTEPTESGPGSVAQNPRGFASFAVAISRHFSQRAQDIAPAPVSNTSRSGPISRTFGRALGAALRLLRIATGLRPVVPVDVRTKSVAPRSVFNLTLDRDNAYYANGILVFNCLTFAYNVEPSDHTAVIAGRKRAGLESNYDPYAEAWSITKVQQRPGWMPGGQR
jgi:hypothetical protein